MATKLEKAIFQVEYTITLLSSDCTGDPRFEKTYTLDRVRQYASDLVKHSAALNVLLRDRFPQILEEQKLAYPHSEE